MGARLPATDPALIYLVAPAGNPNYGDEFILRAWLRYLARVRPDTEVVVDCHTPGQAAVLLRHCHPRVTFVDTVWRICFESADQSADQAVALAADVLDNPGRLPRIVSGVELLTRADTMHLVGGGYLNTVWPHHLSLLATAAAAAQQFGVRAVATGQGLLPTGGDDRRALTQKLGSSFALFDVRDRPSLDALADSGCPTSFTGDDAWLGVDDDGVYDRESPAAARDVVFCLQSDLMDDHDDNRGVEGLAAAVSQLIQQWRLRGEQVAFVEGLPGADRLVYDRVAAQLPGALFVPFTELWNRGVPARAGQTWVSTRFHPHLLAAAVGASGVAVSGRTDYYPIKHESLVAAGSRWQVSVAGALPESPPADGGFDAATVARLRADKLALAAQLYPPPAPPPSRIRRAIRGISRFR
jgi:polysaccharide pyruvyl transferase WcaK-like protein